MVYLKKSHLNQKYREKQSTTANFYISIYIQTPVCNCHSIFRTVKNYPTEIKRVTFEKHCENLVKYARTFKKKIAIKKIRLFVPYYFEFSTHTANFPSTKRKAFALPYTSRHI